MDGGWFLMQQKCFSYRTYTFWIQFNILVFCGKEKGLQMNINMFSTDVWKLKEKLSVWVHFSLQFVMWCRLSWQNSFQQTNIASRGEQGQKNDEKVKHAPLWTGNVGKGLFDLAVCSICWYVLVGLINVLGFKTLVPNDDRPSDWVTGSQEWSGELLA